MSPQSRGRPWPFLLYLLAVTAATVPLAVAYAAADGAGWIPRVLEPLASHGDLFLPTAVAAALAGSAAALLSGCRPRPASVITGAAAGLASVIIGVAGGLPAKLAPWMNSADCVMAVTTSDGPILESISLWGASTTLAYGQRNSRLAKG